MQLSSVKTRLGLKPSTTVDQVLSALKSFGVSDDMYQLLNVYHIAPFETWFIEEHTVHAPGPWPTFEIQRPQDDYNLLAWQLGQQVPPQELPSVKHDHQLKGLSDEEALVRSAIDMPVNTDPSFRENWWKKCEVLNEGKWGRKIQLFYHIFYGEGFIIKPKQKYTREGDDRPYAGIIWSGNGTINGLAIDVANRKRREFLVTPNTAAEFVNTNLELDMMIFTVFPMKL